MKRAVGSFLFLLMLLMLFTACRRTQGDKMDELGLAALKQYCLSTKLTVEEFGQPRIYADPKHDVRIEYVTRLGVSPKHVFLIFIEDGRVVERQRFLEYESTKGADVEVSGISPQESRLEPDAGDRTENEDNGD